jgi:flagellar motor switch protein FliG
MIANVSSAAPAMTGIRKAAILMIILGENSSAEIVKQLGEEEVQQSGDCARVLHHL